MLHVDKFSCLISFIIASTTVHADTITLSPGSDIQSAVDAAADTVAAAISPTDDVHAPAGYRRDMARLLVRRALQAAIQRSEAAA